MIQARAKAGATTGRPPAVGVQEIELKLQVATPDPTRLFRHPFIRRFQDGTVSSRRLHTVYYDTPDLRLATAGVALRVRHQGGERVQAVRTVSGSGVVDTAAVGVHREWLWTLRSDGPDLSVLQESGVRDVVPQDALPWIGPIFFSDFQRTTLTLRPEPSSAVEISVDSGEIRAGRSFRPVNDIDLALKAGPVEALFDLALDLHRAAPLRVALRTKTEIGLALVTGRPPPTPSAPALTLIPVATVADGFRHTVRNGINHLLANEPAVLEAGPAAAREGLDQMGAALRRLRTAFALFGDSIAAPETPRLDHELRWVARRLKPARAWDKVVILALAPFAASHPDLAGVRDLDAAIAAAHAAALARARSALAAPRFMTLILELGGWLEAGQWLRQAATLERPLVALASARLARRHRKVIKAERQCRRFDAQSRHRIGVQLRRLREAVAILRGLYPAHATKPYCEGLDALSALLNDLDDHRAALRLVGGLTAAQGQGDQAADRLIESLREDRHQRSVAFPRLWRGFVDLPPFWI